MTVFQLLAKLEAIVDIAPERGELSVVMSDMRPVTTVEYHEGSNTVIIGDAENPALWTDDHNAWDVF